MLFFPLGQIHTGAGALPVPGERVHTYLDHHSRGEWGVISRERRRLNAEALEFGGGRRVESEFVEPDGTHLVILTVPGEITYVQWLPDADS